MDQKADYSEQIRQHYDSMAPVYRSFWGDHIHHGLFVTGSETPEKAQVNLIDHCIGLLDLKPGSRVFDVGCGHGGTTTYLAEQFGCTVLGITVSEKQQALASKKALSAAVEDLTVFEVADVQFYNFSKQKWDVVWVMESSEHFHDKPRFFRNAADCLDDEGKLLLAAWTGSMQTPRVREVARAFLCPSISTVAEYSEFIQSTGLQILGTNDLTQTVLPTWDICHQRAKQARAVLKYLPKTLADFVEAIDIIREAYVSGDLTYTVITAVKRG